MLFTSLFLVPNTVLNINQMNKLKKFKHLYQSLYLVLVLQRQVGTVGVGGIKYSHSETY